MRRLAFLLAAIIFGSSSLADVPHSISYQGRLIDDNGAVVNDTVTVALAIYNDQLASDKLWTEEHPDVVVSDGLFELLMGSVVPIPSSVFDGSTRYLLIEVNGTPSDSLIPLVSVANAYRSIHSDTAQYALSGTGSSVWSKSGDNVYLPSLSDEVGIGLTSPQERLHIEGNIKLEGGGAVKFGGGVTQLRSTSTFGQEDLYVSGQDDIYLEPRDQIRVRDYLGDDWALIDPEEEMIGIGTMSPEEILHLLNDNSSGRAFMKIQATDALHGEVGIRLETPQNRWHWRMDDYTNNNIPDGALGLRSQDSGAEVMVWTGDGKVGVRNTTPDATLDVNGDVQVSGTLQAGEISGDYADNSVVLDDILNEPGIASAAASGPLSLSTSYGALLTRQITVPASGYILALASVRVFLDHGMSGPSEFAMAVSTEPDDIGASLKWWHYLSSNQDRGSYYVTISGSQLFYAPAQGTYTYYLIGKRHADNSAWAYSRSLNLIYLPTVYSSKGIDDALGSGTDNDGPSSVVEPPELAEKYGDAPDEVDYQQQIDRLTAELEALKNRLEAITE